MRPGPGCAWVEFYEVVPTFSTSNDPNNFVYDRNSKNLYNPKMMGGMFNVMKGGMGKSGLH